MSAWEALRSFRRAAHSRCRSRAAAARACSCCCSCCCFWPHHTPALAVPPPFSCFRVASVRVLDLAECEVRERHVRKQALLSAPAQPPPFPPMPLRTRARVRACAHSRAQSLLVLASSVCVWVACVYTCSSPVILALMDIIGLFYLRLKFGLVFFAYGGNRFGFFYLWFPPGRKLGLVFFAYGSPCPEIGFGLFCLRFPYRK